MTYAHVNYYSMRTPQRPNNNFPIFNYLEGFSANFNFFTKTSVKTYCILAFKFQACDSFIGEAEFTFLDFDLNIFSISSNVFPFVSGRKI